MVRSAADTGSVPIRKQQKALRILAGRLLGGRAAASRSRLGDFFAAAPVALASVAADGRVEAANRRFTEELGYSVEDLPTIESWWELAYPDPDYRATVRASWDESVRRAAGGEIATREVSVRRKDGTTGVYVINGKLVDGSLLVAFVDVSERRRAEDAAREAETTTRLFLDSSPAYYVAIGSDGKVRAMNRALLEALEISEEEAIGRDYLASFVPSEDRLETAAVMDSIVAGGATTISENRVVSRSGREFLIEWRGKPRYLEGGALDFFVGVGIDITERVKTTDALRASERRFRALFENAPIPLAIVARDGRIVDLNRRFESLFGYSRSQHETIDAIWTRAYPDPAARAELGRAWSASIARGGRPFENKENRIRTAGGEDLTCLVSAATLDGEILVSFIDITARKKAEESLAESLERYRALTETAQVGIWQVDAGMRSIYANPAMRAFLGIAPGEDIQGLDSASFFEPHSLARVREEFSRRAEGVTSTYEAVFVSRSGRRIDALVSGAPLRDWEGRFVGSIATFIDITERKRAEENLRKHLERLRGLLAILQAKAGTRQEFLDRALVEAIRLSESDFGYIYFYDEDARLFTLNSWSKGVMAECTVVDPQTRYELDRTGLWGEAVRQRRAIVVNDYAAPSDLKRGYPEGHVALRRFLTVPVLAGGRIVAVVGVANKAEEYDEGDVLQLSLLMDAVWKAVERREAEEAAKAREELLRRQSEGLLALLMGDVLLSGDREAAMRELAEACSRLTGVGRVGVWFYSPDASVIRCAEVYEAATGMHGSGEELRSAGFPACTASHLRGEIVAAADVRADPRTRELPASYFDAHDIRSLLDAPVWVGAKVGALLSLEAVGAARTWTVEDERFATLMATAASLALEAADHREAEKETRVREEALRTIIDAAPYSIVINRAVDGAYVDVNRAYLEAHGLSEASEVLGRPSAEMDDLVDPGEGTRMRAELGERGRLDGYQFRIRRPTGELRHLIASARTLKYRGEDCIVSLTVDVTPLKAAEEGLRRLNAELERKVAERTEDLAQANLELQSANVGLARAMEELRDAQGKILVSEKLAALGRLVAGIAHELNTPLAAIAASSRLELKNLGSGLDELALAVSRLGPEELDFVREARMRASEAARGGTRIEPAAEREARRRAEERLRGAGVPAAEIVAEDLVELGIPDLAERAVPFLLGPRGDDIIALLRGAVGSLRAAQIAEDAVAKASRVVSALRTYARGGEDEVPSRIRLASEIRSLLELYYNRTKRGIGIEVDIPEDLEVFGRREGLGRIWFNILNNAIQAVGERGRIEVGAVREGDAVLVSIADDGPGIPDAIRGRIFEPFFTTKGAGEGTGLGLDIARRLARENGGDISFESRPGRTVFTVRLPPAAG